MNGITFATIPTDIPPTGNPLIHLSTQNLSMEQKMMQSKLLQNLTNTKCTLYDLK